MLTKEICERIWHCHREIEAGNKLIEEVTEIAKNNANARGQRELEKGIKDVFGRDRELELGVPTSDNAKRIFRVSFDLAIPIINAHIANKAAELAELNEIAKLEMSA